MWLCLLMLMLNKLISMKRFDFFVVALAWAVLKKADSLNKLRANTCISLSLCVSCLLFCMLWWAVTANHSCKCICLQQQREWTDWAVTWMWAQTHTLPVSSNRNRLLILTCLGAIVDPQHAAGSEGVEAFRRAAGRLVGGISRCTSQNLQAWISSHKKRFPKQGRLWLSSKCVDKGQDWIQVCFTLNSLSHQHTHTHNITYLHSTHTHHQRCTIRSWGKVHVLKAILSFCC